MKVTTLLAFLVVVLLVSCGKDNASRSTNQASVDRYVYTTNSPAEDYYNANVGPNLKKYCGLCHANPAPTYAAAKGLIKPGDPKHSTLYRAAVGRLPGMKRVWDPSNPKAISLYDWIKMEN